MNRRDFLKLSSLLPLAYMGAPYYYGQPSTGAKNGNAQNVLIILFDTLSAKHISLYGYGRETMPNLAAFAEKATVYHNHYASAPYTTPGTASILTGTYAWTHRALGLGHRVTKSLVPQNLFNHFAEQNYYRIAYTHNPFADLFLLQFKKALELHKPRYDLFLEIDPLTGKLFAKDFDNALHARQGYFQRNDGITNSLFLSQPFNAVMDLYRHQLGLGYDFTFPLGLPSLTSDANSFYVLEHVMDWIQTQLSAIPQPFLGYFHLLPPHDPYKTRADFVDKFIDDGYTRPERPEHVFSDGVEDERMDFLNRRYDEFIPYVDAEFGRLVQFLEDRGMLENTWVVFTSDHGELFERGIHGHINLTLHDGVIRVPLLIHQPGQQERTDIQVNTSCVDLMPTLLHVTGQEQPPGIEGQVLPPYSGIEPDPQRGIFALQPARVEPHLAIETATAMLVRGDFKLVHYFGYEQSLGVEDFYELYNLKSDPEEMNNLYLTDPGLAAKLKIDLAAKLAEVNRPYLR